MSRIPDISPVPTTNVSISRLTGAIGVDIGAQMYTIQDMTRTDPGHLERRFGEQVRRVRVDLGISQVELARLANVSRSAIVNLEAGAGSSLATVTKVLDALGQGEWLLTLVPPPTTFNPLDLLDGDDQRSAPRTRRRVAPRARSQP